VPFAVLLASSCSKPNGATHFAGRPPNERSREAMTVSLLPEYQPPAERNRDVVERSLFSDAPAGPQRWPNDHTDTRGQFALSVHADRRQSHGFPA
jgi:hypothetical protein